MAEGRIVRIDCSNCDVELSRYSEVVVVGAMNCTGWLLVNATSVMSAWGQRSGVMPSVMGVPALVMMRAWPL